MRANPAVRTLRRPEEGVVVTKAVRRAAALLGIPNRVLARILGLSEATISRMVNGQYTLTPGGKPFELAVLLVRLYRSLDAITSGDDEASRTWLDAENEALGGRPVALVQTIPGLIDVIAYLDARRARV